MKKVLTVILAVVLSLGLACTAFAADSQEGSATDAIVKDVTGDVTKDEIVVEEKATVEDATWLSEAKNLGVDTADAEVYFNGDIHLKSGEPFSGTATITFNAENVIAVVHYDGSKYELVGTSATATFTNFSPFAIIVKKDVAPADDKKEDEKSPQTGEFPFVPVMGTVAILAAAGLVISRKKASDR